MTASPALPAFLPESFDDVADDVERLLKIHTEIAEAAKVRPPPISKADITPESFRWYACPTCSARVATWGSLGAPSHCGIELSERVAGDGRASGFAPCGCGATFPGVSGKRGAPRRHCSEECREVAAALVILSRHLDKIERRATPAAWMAMRVEIQARFFRRPWNRGIVRAPKVG